MTTCNICDCLAFITFYGIDGSTRRKNVNRIRDHRWTSRITTWKCYEGKRHRGTPAIRRKEELNECWMDSIWHRTAQCRQMWTQQAEASHVLDTTATQWRWWL